MEWIESALEPVASALAKNICIMCIPLNRISLSKKKKRKMELTQLGSRGERSVLGTNFSFKGIENFRIYRDGIIMKIHFGIETKDILPKWLREEGGRGIFEVENCIRVVFLSFFFPIFNYYFILLSKWTLLLFNFISSGYMVRF